MTEFITNSKTLIITRISGRVGQGGLWYTSIPEKNSPKYPKIPKIHPHIPKIIPRYTLYLKFKESDVPNTRIKAAIYGIPNLKSPCIPYNPKPWPTLFWGTKLHRADKTGKTKLSTCIYTQVNELCDRKMGHSERQTCDQLAEKRCQQEKSEKNDSKNKRA